MLRNRSALAVLATVAIGLAACGDESTSSEPTDQSADAPAATEAPVEETPTDANASEPAPAEEPPATDATEPTDASVPATEAPDTDEGSNESAVEEDPATAAPDAEPPATDAPEPEAPPATGPAGPPVAEIGGRSFAAELDPESDFDGNPFPDLVVRDVTREQDVNIRNIFPADRPVVLWGWAPH